MIGLIVVAAFVTNIAGSHAGVVDPCTTMRSEGVASWIRSVNPSAVSVRNLRSPPGVDWNDNPDPFLGLSCHGVLTRTDGRDELGTFYSLDLGGQKYRITWKAD